MATIQEAVQQFRARTQRYKKMWKGLEIKWAATKSERSMLLAFQGLLTHNTPRRGKDLLSDSSTVEAHWEVISSRQLNHLLDGLLNGTIQLGGKTRDMVDFRDFDVVRDFSGDNYSFYVERPNIWLRGYGSQVKDVVDEREIEADLLKCGYQGLYEATRDNLGFFVGGGASIHFYLVAPIYITTECSLTREALTIEIVCHESVKPNRVWTIYRVGEGPRSKRGKVTFTDDDITKVEGEFYWLTSRLETEPDAKDARVWTYFRGESEPLQQNWVNLREEELKVREPPSTENLEQLVQELEQQGFEDSATFIRTAQERFRGGRPQDFADCKSNCRKALASALEAATGTGNIREAARRIVSELVGDTETDFIEAFDQFVAKSHGLLSKKGSHHPMPGQYEASLALRVTEALLDYILKAS